MITFCCKEDILNVLPEEPLTEEEIEEYLLGVYLGVISTDNLSTDYHVRVTSLFENAIEKGFQENLLDLNLDNDLFTTMQQLRLNVYKFSAAKQYQQVRLMSDLITPDMAFTDFRKVAIETFEEFNKTYLRTEFDTAVGQSQSARDYLEAVAEKEQFPLIQYKTQIDGRVRPEHQVLEGIILPVDDPFWDDYFPKNGWNCRCFTIRLSSGVVTDKSKIDFEQIEDKVPDIFKMNPAKDNLIFNEGKHPYFEVKRGDTQLKRRNFNLPLI